VLPEKLIVEKNIAKKDITMLSGKFLSLMNNGQGYDRDNTHSG
jgi:hypothetical protein